MSELNESRKHIRRARLDELEWCLGVVCQQCAQGVPVKRCASGWIHTETRTLCDAAVIRHRIEGMP